MICLNSKFNWWNWALYSTGFFSLLVFLQFIIYCTKKFPSDNFKRYLVQKITRNLNWDQSDMEHFLIGKQSNGYSMLLWLLSFSKLVLSQNNHGDLPCITSYFWIYFSSFGSNTQGRRYNCSNMQICSTKGPFVERLMVSLQDEELNPALGWGIETPRFDCKKPVD